MAELKRTRRMRDAWLTPSGLLAWTLGCANTAASGHNVAANPWDVIIVPGCPTQEDGTLSQCLKERIVWGAQLWHEGRAHALIVSGAPTVNRYCEAVALAAGLAALAVPPDRIWLEAHARHTDENVYYALRMMQRQHWKTVAVASHPGQAGGACSFLRSWGQACEPLPMPIPQVRERMLQTYALPLHQVRIAPTTDPDWLPVDAHEARRAENGGPDRPSSPLLYWFWAPLTRLFGKPWRPPVEAPDAVAQSYADWLVEPNASKATSP